MSTIIDYREQNRVTELCNKWALTHDVYTQRCPYDTYIDLYKPTGHMDPTYDPNYTDIMTFNIHAFTPEEKKHQSNKNFLVGIGLISLGFYFTRG